MYRGYLNRRRDSQDRTVSAGQSSPGSSASLPLASAAAAVHLHASSQSAVLPAEHASAARRASTSPKNRFFPISISPAPRTSSLARMGQGVSRTEPAAALAHADRTPAPPAPVPSPPPSATRFKRGWPVSRRKKSEDTTSGSGRTERSSDDSSERGRDASLSVISSTFTTPASTPAASVDDLQQAPMLLPPFEMRRPQPPKAPKFSGSAPIPPPKPSQFQLSKPPPSPVDAPADNFLRADSATAPASPGSDGYKSETGIPKEKTDRDLKQDWRKSDATTTSYVTIRPGAAVGTRSPRPVSLAESSHSGHTIIPVNKRLSALITDAEFVMAEEGDSDSEVDVLRIPISGRPSPTSSVKARNRRSASLNLGPGHWSKLASLETTTAHSTQPQSLPQTMPLNRTFTDTRLTPTPARDQPTLSRTAAKGFIAPIATSAIPNPTSSSFRGRLAAWAAFEKQPGQLAPPPTHPMRGQTSPSSSFRQTAVSMTGQLAPVAFGLGKRAAEKVHRVWGGLSASSSNHSAYSSTTSLSGSLHSQSSTHGMDRSTSGQSGNSNAFAPGGWKKNRRTPNAPSGAYSVSSSMTNFSDADSVSSTLGRCLREPRRNGAGMAISGLLFGRDLRACATETAIESVRTNAASRDPNEPPSARALEERALPAFVVRCAQHLRHWGMQEEGLFRINGRAAHISRLRAAFDTGADYDLVECDPGDLDPHAVSSTLKAYLRELPQSILTNALSSLFESVIGADTKDTTFGSNGNFDIMKLRKAPSLSTFQQPNIANMRVVSQETRIALASLIARMPEENRDLLYTVVELIRTTATSSSVTRMPVVNLVVPFSPSLKMSPPLLIALCETPDIWDGPAKVMDAQRPEPPRSAPDDEDEPLTNRNTLHAPNLGELAGSPYRLSNNSGQDDAASYMSALDQPTCPSDGSSNNLPALTTSTDSIATPSTMSEVSSLKPQSLDTQEEDDKQCGEKPPVRRRRPTIATGELALPANPRKTFISAPIPFPSSGEASPRSPVSPSRKSVALLSFPPLAKSDNNPQDSATWAHRPKRPSLHMLFTRKSASPISPSLPNPYSGGAEASSLSVPPFIDTPISSSPIGLFDPSRPQAKVTVTDFSDTPPGSDRSRRDSFASSLFSTPQQTPIADLYRGTSRSPSPSLRATTPDPIPSRPSSVARSSPVPSLDINLEKDDWAESVLQATSATDEPESAWCVKDAVKLFEGR